MFTQDRKSSVDTTSSPSVPSPQPVSTAKNPSPQDASSITPQVHTDTWTVSLCLMLGGLGYVLLEVGGRIGVLLADPWRASAQTELYSYGGLWIALVLATTLIALCRARRVSVSATPSVAPDTNPAILLAPLFGAAACEGVHILSNGLVIIAASVSPLGRNGRIVFTGGVLLLFLLSTALAVGWKPARQRRTGTLVAVWTAVLASGTLHLLRDADALG